MRKLIFFLLTYCLLHNAHSQSYYWQQQVNYRIDVSLNDKENTLDGFERLEYINNSPDTLKFIWFHLWPNAYKNDKTAFSDQLLENGDTKFYFSDKEERGYINRLDFKVNNITAATEDHPHYIDIIKLILPADLAPGQKILITTPFHVKLPFNISRSGYDGQSYQATQWYPKPAVYGKSGWHPMPYLNQGEFYSEFGNFDVRITVPKNYVVAATGELQDEEEKKWLKTRESPILSDEPQRASNPKQKTTGNKTETYPPSDAQMKTLQYLQNNTHDFAWFADKRFFVNYDTCKLSSGKSIEIYTFYTKQQEQYWKNSVQFCKDAIHFYSDHVGEYPYNSVSAVQGPPSFGGGMEYPTITVISPVESEKELDLTIAHELGHNWFYGVLGSNERSHPWMDEGINTFYENKYYSSKYGQRQQIERILFETAAIIKKDQPIETTSENFSEINYELVAYNKTSEWMRYLQEQLGTESFNKAMQEYYRQWQFKHPQPEDFKKSIEQSTGKDLDSIFAFLSTKGILPNEHRNGWKVISIFNPNSFSSYIKNPSKDVLFFSPVFGFNNYDKFMIGGIFTNCKLPPSPFQFLFIPMYGTGSKKLVGLGRLNYTFYPDNRVRKIELFLNGSTFTQDRFIDSAGKKIQFGFEKIVPGIRITMKEKNARSTLNKYIQWKTFFIREDELRFSRDTIITGTDTSIAESFKAVQSGRRLNQLKFVIENYRGLYPFSAELKIEQAQDFVRTAFTGNYFFNYAKGGGLEARFFAGKFFYTTAKTLNKQFSTDRYHFNMTGPNGYEDYTYSDYFIGRNNFEGLASQQIMLRDGAFKIRTDLLADKIGKSDDWLIAANFDSSIPDRINPLSLLPIKIPLKIFADIGTYAEAWKPGAGSDRFLFDAGLHIPLFKETINIYIPLVYSRVYKDYILSTLPKRNRLLKTLSFTIDISNLDLKRIDRQLGFL